MFYCMFYFTCDRSFTVLPIQALTVALQMGVDVARNLSWGGTPDP